MDLALMYKWINFAIFASLLFYFLREPIKDFLGDRRETLKKELDELSGRRLQTESHFQKYRKKMNASEQEMKNLMEELRKEGEIEKSNLIKKSQSFAEKIKEDAKKMGTQEIAKAKHILKQKTLLLALNLAKERLKKTIDAQDHSRLALWAIKHLEEYKGERTASS